MSCESSAIADITFTNLSIDTKPSGRYSILQRLFSKQLNF